MGRWLDLADSADISIRSRDAYRDALRTVWRLMADGPAPSQDECRAALDEVARLIDDVGEPLATSLRRAWEVEWFREKGVCPRCGNAEFHGGPAGGT